MLGTEECLDLSRRGMTTKINIGDKFKSRSYGEFTVSDYINSKDVIITFDKTGYTYSASAGNIRNGLVKDNLAKSVYGVGYFGFSYWKR